MCTLKCIKLLLSKEGLSLARRFSLPPRRKVRNLCRTPQPDRVINGRSPDLRVLAFLGLPVVRQWLYPASLSAYSCGGSRRLGFSPHCVPFYLSHRARFERPLNHSYKLYEKNQDKLQQAIISWQMSLVMVWSDSI